MKYIMTHPLISLINSYLIDSPQPLNIQQHSSWIIKAAYQLRLNNFIMRIFIYLVLFNIVLILIYCLSLMIFNGDSIIMICLAAHQIIIMLNFVYGIILLLVLIKKYISSTKSKIKEIATKIVNKVKELSSKVKELPSIIKKLATKIKENREILREGYNDIIWPMKNPKKAIKNIISWLIKNYKYIIIFKNYYVSLLLSYLLPRIGLMMSSITEHSYHDYSNNVFLFWTTAIIGFFCLILSFYHSILCINDVIKSKERTRLELLLAIVSFTKNLTIMHALTLNINPFKDYFVINVEDLEMLKDSVSNNKTEPIATFINNIFITTISVYQTFTDRISISDWLILAGIAAELYKNLLFNRKLRLALLVFFLALIGYVTFDVSETFVKFYQEERENNIENLRNKKERDKE